MLSAKTISIKDLKDPEIEAFVYYRFFPKCQVTLPQSAPIECKDHRLEEIYKSLMAPIPLQPHHQPFSFKTLKAWTEKNEINLSSTKMLK